jgi:hypothetical protein
VRNTCPHRAFYDADKFDYWVTLSRSFPFPGTRLFFQPINHMTDGQYWMTPGHAGPGILHNDTNLIAQLWLIAMDRTVAAGRLVFLKRTILKPQPGVFHQFPALMTELSHGMMVVPAVESDH